MLAGNNGLVHRAGHTPFLFVHMEHQVLTKIYELEWLFNLRRLRDKLVPSQDKLDSVTVYISPLLFVLHN